MLLEKFSSRNTGRSMVIETLSSSIISRCSVSAALSPNSARPPEEPEGLSWISGRFLEENVSIMNSNPANPIGKLDATLLERDHCTLCLCIHEYPSKRD